MRTESDYGDDLCWRDGKKLPRLLNKEQRPGQEQEQRAEEIRGKGKEKEGKEQKTKALKRQGREREGGGETGSDAARLRGTQKGCQGR